MRTIFVVLLAASVASAATKDEEARKYFDAGKQAYEAEQYGAAALAFEEAYKLAPRPAILFSLAQAHRKQYLLDRDRSHLERAVDLYRRYVAENPNGTRLADALQLLSTLEPLLARGAGDKAAPGQAGTQLLISSRTPGATASIDGERPVTIPILLDVKAGTHRIRASAPGFHPEEAEAVAVQGRLVVHDATLKEIPARLSIRGDDGASVSLDGRLVGTTPFPRPLEVESGRRFLTVTRSGHRPLVREITLQRGQELTVDADLSATPQRVAAWWLLGGAAALVVAGGTTTVLAFLAQSEADDYQAKVDRMENPTPSDLADYNDAKSRRDDYVTASAVLYGGAVALGVTGLVLFLTDGPRVEAPPPTVVPTVGPEGDVGVSVSTRF